MYIAKIYGLADELIETISVNRQSFEDAEKTANEYANKTHGGHWLWLTVSK